MQETINRLEHFPIMMFGVVMGFGGISIAYTKATQWLGFSAIIGEALSYLTVLLFLVITTTYIVKFFKYKEAVKKEFAHPIRINFFAAISISMLMITIIFRESNELLSAIFWYPAVVLHFYLTMHTVAFWINNNQEIEHSNPAWFIPIVGNVLVPVGGVGFVSNEVLLYFFSIGIFFWIVLFALILNRIIFHKQLAIKFMPTLFILIAPPAVGFIAYFKMFEVVDTFAMILFELALFFTFLIAFMYKNFIKIKFFISWWAFVFPVAAITIDAMLMYHIYKSLPMLVLSYILLASLSIIIAIVLYQTMIHMSKKEICIEE